MNSNTCCQIVSWLKFTVANPHTVIALTELNSASMYVTGYLPLLAYKIPENMRGVKVLNRDHNVIKFRDDRKRRPGAYKNMT